MAESLLFVIDLQRCFIKESNTGLPERIKEHIEDESYDKIVFSKFINSQENPNFRERLGWEGCSAGEETEIVEELKEPAEENIIVEKHTYSVFKSEEAQKILEEEDLGRVDLCGADIDGCVLASAFEAFDLGLDFKILMDLTHTKNGELQEAAQKVI